MNLALPGGLLSSLDLLGLLSAAAAFLCGPGWCAVLSVDLPGLLSSAILGGMFPLYTLPDYTPAELAGPGCFWLWIYVWVDDEVEDDSLPSFG